jgi:hypothetical protein
LLAEAISEFAAGGEYRPVLQEARPYLECYLKIAAAYSLTSRHDADTLDTVADALRRACVSGAHLTPLGRALRAEIGTLLECIPVELDLTEKPFPNAAEIYHVVHHGGPGEDEATATHARWVRDRFPTWEKAFAGIIDAIDAHVAEANRGLALGTAQVAHPQSEHVPLREIEVAKRTVEIGRVAADDGTISVFADDADERAEHLWPAVQCAMVATDGLRPVAFPGQIAVFASPEVQVRDGDLALMAWNDEAYLRRVFSVAAEDGGRAWVGQSVNPHRRDCAPIILRDGCVHLRKLVGVLFQGSDEEWQVLADAPGELAPLPQPLPAVLKALLAGKLAMIEVRGASAEPIALEGQYALVAEPISHTSQLHRDALYDFRLDDGRCMLKRLVFPEGPRTRGILQAINTTPGFPPVEVSFGDEGADEALPHIEEARQVLGVLFSSPETFAG